MALQLETLLSRHFDLICNFESLALSGSDALMRCQFKHARAMLELGGDQLRDALPESAENWPAPGMILRDAFASSRECLVAAAKWQAETMRLIAAQAAQARTLVVAADQHFLEPAIEVASEAGHRGARGRKGEHQLAA